ncbi:MAG: UDP-N-acetylmuramate dehydrogenase [Bacillota bacterium]
MNKVIIAELLANLQGTGAVTVNEPMAEHTSFKIGGAADVFVKPRNIEGLVNVVNTCMEKRIPLFVMGNGTNLLVRDKGIRGVVMQVAENIGSYEVEGECIAAEAGISLSKLARIAMEHGLSGLEFAEGIPGTLGGAVAMNAGAYDGEMSMVVEASEYLSPDGNVVTVGKSQHRFGKRTSFVQTDGGVVLKTRLKLRKDDKERIKAKMEEFRASRQKKQPLDLPSAGSIFKRPEGYFAGKLIQDCGLRGFRIGDAEVSGLHCGFIVNRGNASAEDVLKLIEYIREKVYARFGVELQTEVKIVGEA